MASGITHCIDIWTLSLHAIGYAYDPWLCAKTDVQDRRSLDPTRAGMGSHQCAENQPHFSAVHKFIFSMAALISFSELPCQFASPCHYSSSCLEAYPE